MISMSEIEQMSRDAYERGKREGAAEAFECAAQIAGDWDWRSSGDNTNTDIARAIREQAIREADDV
jgi:hypothetical protein